MNKQPESGPTVRQPKEAVTPFVERALNELLLLVGQLFTTPFAMVLNTKQFQQQSIAFARDELNTGASPTIARPVLYYLLWMGVHFLLADLYFNAILLSEFKPDTVMPLLANRLFGWTSGNIAGFTANGYGYYKIISDTIGKTEALILLAFGVLLIIAIKAALISIVGAIFRIRVHFGTILKATAYAFGTFVFFQYAFVAARILSALLFGQVGSLIGYYIIAYGSLVIAVILVVRVLQIIQSVDETGEVETFGVWLIGTIIWHALAVYASIFAFRIATAPTLDAVLAIYAGFLSAFFPFLF